MSTKGGVRATTLRERGAALGSAIVFAVSCLGCMSFTTLPSKTEVIHRDESSEWQSGKNGVPPGEEVTVYYPSPYCSPPNLELEGGDDNCRIIDQRGDHFKIKNVGDFPRVVVWKSRGVRIFTPGPIHAGYMQINPVAPVTPVAVEAPVDAKKASLTVEPASIP